jgi:hypothetical protein
MNYNKTFIEAIAHHLDEFDITFDTVNREVIVSFVANKTEMTATIHGNGYIGFNGETFTSVKTFADKFDEVVGVYRRKRPFLRVEVNHDFWRKLGVEILPRFIEKPIIHVAGNKSSSIFVADEQTFVIRSFPDSTSGDIGYQYSPKETNTHYNLENFLDLVESDLEKKLL